MFGKYAQAHCPPRRRRYTLWTNACPNDIGVHGLLAAIDRDDSLIVGTFCLDEEVQMPGCTTLTFAAKNRIVGMRIQERLRRAGFESSMRRVRRVRVGGE